MSNDDSSIEKKCDLLFFDQSVLGRLVDGLRESVNFSRKFEEELSRLRITTSSTSVHVQTSAFSLLELVGVNRKVTIPYDSHKKKVDRLLAKVADDPEKMKVEVFNYFQQQVIALPQVQQKFLLKELATKRDMYASSIGKVVITYLIENYVGKSGLEDHLAQSLAVDRVYGYPYPDKLMHTLCCSFLVDIMRNLSEGHDYNQCRGLQCVMANMLIDKDAEKIGKGTNTNPEELKTKVQSILEAINFEPNKDLVDMEVAHFANVGKFDVDRKLKSVLCFTIDDESQTRKRVSMIRACVTFIVEQVKEAKAAGRDIPFDLVYPQLGAIAYVEKSGEIRKIEMVKDLPDVWHL